jgi:hypothetical protein
MATHTDRGTDDPFVELARIAVAGSSVDDVLRRITELAIGVGPGVEDASITLIQRRRPHATVFAGPLGDVLDERRHEPGHGPCRDAAATAGVVLVPDTVTDTVYPEFSATAARHGVRCVLAVGLTMTVGTAVARGALGVYARDALTDHARTRLLTFADGAAAVVTNVMAYQEARLTVEQMTEAMATRSVIEQAKGMIMCARGCDAQEAFAILRQTSMEHNRKLRDLAAALVQDAATAGAPAAEARTAS